MARFAALTCLVRSPYSAKRVRFAALTCALRGRCDPA